MSLHILHQSLRLTWKARCMCAVTCCTSPPMPAAANTKGCSDSLSRILYAASFELLDSTLGDGGCKAAALGAAGTAGAAARTATPVLPWMFACVQPKLGTIKNYLPMHKLMLRRNTRCRYARYLSDTNLKALQACSHALQPADDVLNVGLYHQASLVSSY